MAVARARVGATFFVRDYDAGNSFIFPFVQYLKSSHLIRSSTLFRAYYSSISVSIFTGLNRPLSEIHIPNLAKTF